MRLRDAGFGATVVFALFVLAACHGLKNEHVDYKLNKPAIDNLKSDTNTPQMASLNEVALAQEYIRDGHYEVALDRLQRAVKLDPLSADAYTMLGLLYEKINRPEQAEANYAKAVKLAPNKGDILNNYGAWMCRSGHPVEADALFRSALNDPFYKTPAVAIGNAATCALKAGKPGLAEAYYRQILTLNATDTSALQEMATLSYQRADYLRARAFMERLLATGNTTPDMLDLAASIEDKLGDADGARGYRSRIASEFPQYVPGKN
ncbi:MAG: type IV pilus biogenesis/stability protein PilW [Lysobacteraceae bacterium]